MPLLRRIHHVALRTLPRLRPPLQMPQMRLYGTLGIFREPGSLAFSEQQYVIVGADVFEAGFRQLPGFVDRFRGG